MGALRSLWRLRLVLGGLVLVGAVLSFLATSWDIQWHTLIGRDRTLIPPHQMILAGVGLAGLAAVADIVVETVWARRDRLLAEHTVRFADLFNGSLGAYLAGFGALGAGGGFPLDVYWHGLYGIDVSIWAPFHLLIIGAMGIATLGGALMLASASRLAAAQEARAGAWLGRAGSLAAFAAAMNIFTFLVFDDLGTHNDVALGQLALNPFPLAAGLVCAGTLVAAVRTVPGRLSATGVAAFSLLLVIAAAVFVPPATHLLVQLEHERFRVPDPGVSLIAFRWPLTPFLAAILVDVAGALGRRAGLSANGLLVTIALACLVACLPVLPTATAFGLQLAAAIGPGGAAASLLLGAAGTLAAAWVGRRTAESLEAAEAA